MAVSNELKSLAKEMVTEGASNLMISDIVGVNMKTVSRWRKNWGLVGTGGVPRRKLECGTKNSYEQGCRCLKCRVGNAAYANARRAERYAITAATGLPDTVAHGSAAYRNWGCRCEVCFTAHSDACKAYNNRRKELAS